MQGSPSPYTFSLGGDDGSYLFFNGSQLIDNHGEPCLHTMIRTPCMRRGPGVCPVPIWTQLQVYRGRPADATLCFGVSANCVSLHVPNPDCDCAASLPLCSCGAVSCSCRRTEAPVCSRRDTR